MLSLRFFENSHQLKFELLLFFQLCFANCALPLASCLLPLRPFLPNLFKYLLQLFNCKIFFKLAIISYGYGTCFF